MKMARPRPRKEARIGARVWDRIGVDIPRDVIFRFRSPASHIDYVRFDAALES